MERAEPDAATREKFVGAWRLVSIETIRPNGEVIYPFYGKHPEGMIMYDKSGWISVQIVSDPAAKGRLEDLREEDDVRRSGRRKEQRVQISTTPIAGPGLWTLLSSKGYSSYPSIPTSGRSAE